MAKEKKTVEKKTTKKKKDAVSNVVTQAIDGSNIIISQNGEQKLRIPRNSCKTFTFDDYNVTIVRFKIRNIEKWAVFSNNTFFLRTSPFIAAQSVTKVKTKQKAILSQIMKRD